MSGVAFVSPVSPADLATALATKANAASLGTLAQQVATKADASRMPTPAEAPPPPVAIDSSAGSAAPYARADHTHESRLQARRVQLALVNGQAVYTFPKPYDAGVVPIVAVTAETPAGQVYRYDAVIVQGSTTNTQTTIAVSKVNQNVVAAALNSVLPIFVPAAGSVWVNILSRAPS